MERAIHITKLSSLKYHSFRYKRLYFGTEFCQNLIPSANDLAKVLDFVRKRNTEFTLVTPFVTEKGLHRLNKLFETLRNKKIECEIVVNDWGILEVLSKRYKAFKLSLGRLLTRQNRDPATAKALEKQLPMFIKAQDGKMKIIVHAMPDKRYRAGIRACYVNTPSVYRLLSEFGIGRVELNNVIQGLNFENMGFKVSLYTPFVNISTTRFCPMGSRFQKIYRINVCNQECQKYYLLLRSKYVPKTLYLRGNTTFYKNAIKLNNVDKLAVDRVVFQPELPF
jgi:hypothetical protein